MQHGSNERTPTKANGHGVMINQHDAINIVEPLLSEAIFSRMCVTTHGIDLMFCDGLGSEVWARHRSKIACEVPYLLDLIDTMNAEPNDVDENAGADASTEVLVQPGTSMFFYQNSALKVQSMSNNGTVECEVTQSSNDALVLGTIV